MHLILLATNVVALHRISLFGRKKYQRKFEWLSLDNNRSFSSRLTGDRAWGRHMCHVPQPAGMYSAYPHSNKSCIIFGTADPDLPF